MDLNPESTSIWPRIEERFNGSAMSKNILNSLRQQSSEVTQGETVASLGETSIDALVEKITAELELRISTLRLQHTKRRLIHATEALTLQVYEDEGIELGNSYTADPHTCSIRKSTAQTEPESNGSQKHAASQICTMITEALDNIFTAWQMARDHNLPDWFRLLARAISNATGDDAELLAPQTRELLQAWLEHPIQAREWAELMEGDSPDFLLQAARVIGLTGRWRV